MDVGEDGYEWLHLVPFNLGNSEAQKPENLVAGSKHANSVQILIESLIKFLVDKFGSEMGLSMDIESDLILGTHVAIEIRYELRFHGENPICFEVNAQDPVKPFKQEKYVFDYLARKIIKNALRGRQRNSKRRKTLFFEESNTEENNAEMPLPFKNSTVSSNPLGADFFQDISNTPYPNNLSNIAKMPVLFSSAQKK